MKKLLNKKLLIPASLSILVIFIVILYKLGFRITYAPEIENSWNAVSAVATCVGVLASFIAIWFAIRVPKKIAEEQNKIALFEKRFTCYSLIQSFLACAQQLEDIASKKEIQTLFRVYFGDSKEIVENGSPASFMILIKQKEQVIISGEFLFEHYNTELLQAIMNEAIDLIRLSAYHSQEEKEEKPLSEKLILSIKDYSKKCKEFEDNYLVFLEEELQLNRKKSR